MVEDYKELTVALTKQNSADGTVTVTNGSSVSIPDSGGGKYHIKKSDGSVTVKIEANDESKITAFSEGGFSSHAKEASATVTYETMGDSKEITATLDKKVQPKWAEGTPIDGTVHQKGKSGDLTYEYTPSADYTFKSYKVEKGSESKATGESLSGNKLTLDAATLNTDLYTPGTDYKVTFTFEDNYTHTTYTLERKFTITAAPTVTQVTLPTDKVHGDNLGEFKLKIDDAGEVQEYTYTASTGSWTPSNPSDSMNIVVTVTNGETRKAEAVTLDKFITDYVATGKIVRHSVKSGTDATNAPLCNGDSIAVSIPGTTPATADLTVGKMPVTLTVTKAANKVYDGTDTVAAGDLDSWTVEPDKKPVDGDVTGGDFSFTGGNITLSGTYNNENAGSGKTVTYKAAATASFTESENYDFTVTGQDGTITKKQITVQGSEFNDIVPQEEYNDNDLHDDGHATGFLKGNADLAESDRSSGLNITYTYQYQTGTEEVTIDGVKAEPDNYDITVSGNATGKRKLRTVSNITVTPNYTAGNAFYSSDTFDATITINYTDGGDPDEYPTIAAALADDSKIASVNWTEGATTAQGTTLKVATHDGKTVTATVKTDAVKAGDVTSGTSAAITVKRIPVVVTVTADAGGISKTYDGTKTCTPVTHGNLSYTAAVDKSALSAAGVAVTDGYNMGSVTATGATVAFAQADVYHAIYNGTDTRYEDVATASEGTLSDDTEYEVTDTVSEITHAQITQLTITVDKIDYIKSVRVGSAGVRKGQAKVAAVPGSAPPEEAGYTAFVTLNDTGAQDIAKKDNLLFDIKYEYDDTKTTHENNSAEVTLHSVTLADSNTKKDNYTFKPLESKEDANSVDGHGTVTAANIESVKLTLPSSLNPNSISGNGEIEYGDTNYKFNQDAGSTTGYNGLTIEVAYDGSDGTVKYVWESNDSRWAITDSEVTTGTIYAEYDKKPFTLTWEKGGDDDTYDTEGVIGEIANIDGLKKGITWTVPKSGRKLTAKIGEEAGSKTVTVKPKEITVEVRHNGSNDYVPEKNFDNDNELKPALSTGGWTFAPTDAITEDNISVNLKGGLTVTYLDNSADDNISLHFGNSYGETIVNSDWTISGANEEAAKSYTIGELTGVSKGKINPRPITLESITGIPAVNQFEKHNSTLYTATSGEPKSGEAKANFADPDGSDDEGTGTGTLPDVPATISFNYHYTKTEVAATPAGIDNGLQISGVTCDVSNYALQPVDVATLPRWGEITAAKATNIEIKEPTMFTDSHASGKKNVQYGDKFDYTGIEVTITYAGATAKYTLPEDGSAFSDGNIAYWMETVGDAEVSTRVAAAAVPFELYCDHSESSGSLHKQGKEINYVNEAGDNGGLHVRIKTDHSIKDEDGDALVVYRRQVDVAAAPDTEIKKTYDGTKTYSSTDGAIKYTLTPQTTKYNEDYELPGEISASAIDSDIEYDSENATGLLAAKQVNIKNITLSGSDKENYELTKKSAVCSATIEKRAVTITEVHKLPSVVQGSIPTDQIADNVTTDEIKSPYAKVSETTPVAGSDVLDLTVDYKYDNTKTATDDDAAIVTINKVEAKAGTNTALNYNVTAASPVTGRGTVKAANYSVEVTNPDQLKDGSYEFNDEGLKVDGLKVTVTNTEVPSNKTEYFAVEKDGAIEWHEGSAEGTKVDEANLPFTLKWSGANVGEGTDVKPGMKLPPAQYNGAQLTATLTKTNTDPSTPSSVSGGTVTVNKKKISKVTASGTGIEKVYDGNTDVSQDITYTIDPSEFVTSMDESDTFTVTADAAYNNKHVGDGKNIVFTHLHATVTSDNYELASDASVTTTVTGKITAKSVDITDVYVPSITVDAVNPHTDIVKKGATAVSTSGTLRDGQVRASGFLPDEITYFTFDYTIVYREDDVKGNGGTTDVFVTLKDTNSAATAGAEAADVQATDYNIQWTTVAAKSAKSNDATAYKDFAALQSSGTGANKAEYLLGNVVADEYTEVSPPTDSGDKITSEVNPHTHGDPLDLTGLSITVKSTTNYQTPATFTIGGTAGAQYWTKDGAKTVLPEGVTVTIGHTSITTEADLANLQAHYKNMNGEHITVSAPGAGRETITQQSEKTVVVKKAELTAEPSEKTDIDKYYDGTNEVKDNITYTVTGKKTFASKEDEVNVTNASAPKYAGSDVVKLVDAVQSQNITFDLQLTGTDSENYTVKTIEGVTGKINPRTVVVSKLGANVKANPIEYKATTTTGTIPSVSGSRTDAPDKYIYNGNTGTEGEWPSSLNAPEVTISYDYGTLVNNTPGDVTINKTGSSSDSFTMAFAAPTDNFVLNYDTVTTLPGTVTRAAITLLTVAKGKTDYYYGDTLTNDKLADLEITVNGTDTFSYFAGGEVNPKFAHYGLTLEVKNGDGTTIADGDRDTTVLKHADTNQAKITVSGGGQSQDVNLTVNKRKLIVKAAASINKEYDGTPAATDLGLIVAPKEEQTGDGYGLAEADKVLAGADYTTAFNVTDTGAMYTKGGEAVKNAWVSGDSYNITAKVTLGTTTGIPTDQYELELKDVKGKINPKPVTLTPKLERNYYKDNTNISISEEPYKAETFVPGEENNYKFTYKIKLSAATHNTANTHTISAAAASGTGAAAYKSTTVSDGTDEYEWEITATNPTYYPLTNYTFTEGDASVIIKDRSVLRATIVENPEHSDKIMRKTYSSGDGIDYKGLTVRVVYSDTDGEISIDYTYNSDWLSSFQIVLSDDTPAPEQDAPLKTADSGKTFKVKITDSVTTENSTSAITVNPKKLTVTAKRSGTASRPYDGTADASAFVTYELVGAPEGITLNSTNTASAVFTGVNPSYAGTNKQISITANDSSFTLEGTDAGEYAVEWKAPDTPLTGEVTKLNIKVKSLPLLRAAQNSDATAPVDVLTSGQIIGKNDRTTVVLDDTDGSDKKMPAADQSAFRASWTATFPIAVLKKTDNLDVPENLSFKDGNPVVTNESGSDALFTTNYDFEWPVPRGIIVPAAIEITDSTASPSKSTHGDALNLNNLKFTVKYHSAIEYTVTFRNVSGQWQKKDESDSDFVSIAPNELSDTYGVTLSWEDTGTIINPDGSDYANYANNGKTIVISVPYRNGHGDYATANTGTVTIGQRPIYAFVRKRNGDADITIDKQYDGNNLADPSGLEFDFYDYTVTGDGNTAPNNENFEKYDNPFPEESIKIDVPAKGTAATYNQLRAEYLGGTEADNASYKKVGEAWVACAMEGKDVKRDNLGNVVQKTIQLSNLHLTGVGSSNYLLANADKWTLNAVDSDFDRYYPSDKDALDVRNQLKGTISQKPLSITVTSVPSIAKSDSGGTKTVTLDASNYTVSGKVDGDTLSNIQLTATYSDQSKVGGQETTIAMSGTEADYPELNYSITSSPNRVNGMVNDKGISKVEITTQPTEKAYVHGDILDLRGMVVRVTYSDNSYNEYTYDGDNNSTLPWKLRRYGSDTSQIGEAENVGSIQDVTLTWNGNRAVETKYNSENAAMIYSAADMGYTANSADTKSTKIKVTPTIPTTPESSAYAAAAESEPITVRKRQLALKIEGKLTKMYNGSNLLYPNTIPDGSGGTNGDKLAVTIVDGTTKEALPTTLDVTFDKKAIEDYKVFTLESKDGKPDSYVGEKNINVTLSELRPYIQCVKGGTVDSYMMPQNASDFVINEASGEIVRRPLIITAKSQADLPTLDLNKDLPDDTGGTKYTKKLIKPDNIKVEGPSGITGIMQYEGQDEVEVDWSIVFDIETIDKNSATEAPIEFTEGSLKAAAHAEDTASVVANYAPAFHSNDIENGNVTPLSAAKGITATPPSKSEYKHGDTLDLTDMTVTVTKGDNTTETYTYTADGWKKEGTVVPETDLPFELYWTDASGADVGTPQKAENGTTLSLTDPKNGATGDDGEDKMFHLSVRSKSDSTKHAEVNITVSRLQLKLFVSGTATKVYDKTDKLVKVDGDVSNTYAITAVLKPAGAADAVVTVDNVDDLVTAGTIKYGDTRAATPASYVGTSPDKTITVELADLGVTLTDDNAKIYKLPASAETDIDVSGVTRAEITKKPITLAVTEEKLKDFTWNAASPTRKLDASEYDVYAGTDATGDLISSFLTDDSVGVDWYITYSGVTFNPNSAKIATDTAQTKLTGDAAVNYEPTWKLPETTGKVHSSTDPQITVTKQPTVSDPTAPEYGDETNWDDFEYEVKKPDGSTTKHKWDNENKTWVTTGDYTKPEDGTKFKWDDTEVDPDNFKDITDKKLDVGDNKLTITVPNGSDDPITGGTNTFTASKRKITAKVTGLEDKVYDGTTAATGTPSITFDNAVDEIPTSDITVEFADKNVAVDSSGNVTTKPVTVKGVTIPDNLADKYELANDPAGTDGITAESNAKITPREIKVVITAPAIKTDISDSAKTISKTGIGYSANPEEDKYTLTGNTTLADGDTVTLKYSGTYQDITTGTKTTVGKTTNTERDAVFKFTQAPAIENTQLANNYTLTCDITYEVTSASDNSSHSSGGGGGGGGNSLIIYYELEDGKKGEIVPSKIEVPLGTDPTDLMAEIKYKLNDMTVTWSSDNEKVATVDENGIVTYVGEGQATITAVSNQNKQLKDTVKVTVTKGTASATPTPSPTPTPDYENNKTDSLITGEMLNPYIVGYDDYVFGPELPISREELSAIFARLIANSIYMDKEYDTSFPDVPETWSKTYIGYLEGFNVVTGYEDGTFRPHNYITRAEMAVMMAKAEGYDISGTMDASELDFSDVDQGYSTWAVKAIKILTDKGIMQGYTDGTFRPGQPITRAETVATVNRVLADMEVADIEILPSDVTDAHWAYNDIVFAMNHRVLKDAAADPNKFIWSEQFDENMVKTNGKTAGTANDTPSEDNTSDGGADAPSDSGQAGTTE